MFDINNKNQYAIWGSVIPFNTGESKADVMHLTDDKEDLSRCSLPGLLEMFSKTPNRSSVRFDNLTWAAEIKPGTMSAYFDDVPNLTAFLCPGSDTAVIVAPGGGFCFAARDVEGMQIAGKLNELGISAFVLEYRLNPYRAPVPWLDMQRAIRFVRYHALNWGIHPDRIGTLGFSAGAYASAAAALLLEDTVPAAEGYEADAIDAVSGKASFNGLLYPVVSFYENPNVLGVLAGEEYYNPAKLPELQKEYSLTGHLTADAKPQFICRGTKDPLKGTAEYISRLEELGVKHEVLLLEGAFHGFALTDERYSDWIKQFTAWINNL